MTGIPSYSAQYKISFISAKSKFVEQNFSKVIQCSGKIKDLVKFNIYSNQYQFKNSSYICQTQNNNKFGLLNHPSSYEDENWYGAFPYTDHHES